MKTWKERSECSNGDNKKKKSLLKFTRSGGRECGICQKCGWKKKKIKMKKKYQGSMKEIKNAPRPHSKIKRYRKNKRNI